MDAPRTSSAGRHQVDERVRAHLRVQRRRQIVRRLAVIVAVMAVLTVLALLNRDAQTMRGFRAEAEHVASAFQRALESSGVPPQRFPELDARYAGAHGRWEFNMLYTEQLRIRRPIGVCRLRHPVRMILRHDGYFVVLFDGRSFAAAWMTRRELEARGAELGLDLSSET